MAMSNICILSDSSLIAYEEQAPVNTGLIRELFENDGHKVRMLSASELGSYEQLNAKACDLLILPYGPVFPYKAVENFKRFFREGGKVLTTGGYAFRHVLRTDRNEVVFLGSNVPKKVFDWLSFDSSSIPIFDAEHALNNVSYIQSAENQYIFDKNMRIEGQFEGWSAITVLGNNRGRWQPLINAYDENGCIRGTIGAIMHLFIEPDEVDQQPDIDEWKDYKGSSIAFFGVTNKDLFAFKNEYLREGFLRLARHLVDGVYIGFISNKYDNYRQGESPEFEVCLVNSGKDAGKYELKLEIYDVNGRIIHSGSALCSVESHTQTSIPFAWRAEKFDDDFYVVRATCISGKGEKVDTVCTGFSVWDENVIQNGVKFVYENNYLYVTKPDGTKKAVFATGTDDGANTLLNLDQTPLVYKNDMQRFKDMGLYIYENLQQYPEQVMFENLLKDPVRKERHFRKVDNIVYLTQKYGLIYKMGMAICCNVACSEEKLEELAADIKQMADRYKSVPGLIFYLNGDLVCRLSDSVKTLFNDFLKKRYLTDENIRKYWGNDTLKLGYIEIENYAGENKSWCDNKAFDYSIFKAQLIKRWTDRLIKAIKEVDDKNHPIVCEFYASPKESVDIPWAIGDLTYSNIGFFGDYHNVSETLGYIDQRYKGKSFGIGEFGKRTHPLFVDAEWFSHRSTSKEEAMKHFFQIFNTTLSMGGNHLLTWCNRDESKYTFPWGFSFALDNVPRDIYYWMRNCNLFCRQFEPVYRGAEVGIILPDNTRQSAGHKPFDGHHAALRAISILQYLNVGNILTLNECDLMIDPRLKVLFYPIAYNPGNEVYNSIKEWVKNGGVLYFSGDISYDQFRQRSFPERLEELAGVRVLSMNYYGADYNNGEYIRYHSIDEKANRKGKPGMKMALSGAKALYVDDENCPIITENRFGKGMVVFSADPLEFLSDEFTLPGDMDVYRHVLKLAHIQSDRIISSNFGVKFFELPLKDDGRLYHFSNLSHEESIVSYKKYQMTIKGGDSHLLCENPQGELIGVLASGTLNINGAQMLDNSSAYAFVYSHDCKGISESSRLVVLPQKTGKIRIKSRRRWKMPQAANGQIADGKWSKTGTLPLIINDGFIEIFIGTREVNTIILLTETDYMKEFENKLVERMLDY